ncbi:MAG: DUF1080 domain-containing protein [Bacteroidota bacterium]
MYKSVILTAILSVFCLAVFGQDDKIPEVDWDELNKTKPWETTELYKEVPKVNPGSERNIPSDAIPLFTGSDQNMWQKPQSIIAVGMMQFAPMIKTMKSEYTTEPAEWKVENGELEVVAGKGPIATKKAFGDIQLHIEWLTPKAEGKSGQQYSNSGVIFMGLYEVQILNSYENETYSNGQASSVYKQHIPLANASRPPGEWQEYDIIFMAPKFSEKGSLLSPARITVLHNGVLVQNNVELLGPTCYIGTPYYVAHPEKLPLILQDHGDPVKFRNIWVREL